MSTPPALPASGRRLEDYVVGATYALGSIAVEEAEVLAFANRFDPQAFHTDPDAAATGPFGGLIASGWHTTALMMRLYALSYLGDVPSYGSPGVDEVRWPAPVRPGDVLSAQVTVQDRRVFRSKPDRGIVQGLVEVFNQTGARC